MLGPPAVAVLHQCTGRRQAHVPRADRVHDTVDGEFACVPVQVQLPQIRQPEYVAKASGSVHADAHARHTRWLIQAHLDEGAGHG